MPPCLIVLPVLCALSSSPRFYFLPLELSQKELLLKSFLIISLVTQMNGALLNSHNVAQADSTFRCSLSELAFLSNNRFSPFFFLLLKLMTWYVQEATLTKMNGKYKD